LSSENSRDNAFILGETRGFMPQMGPMLGYAVTVCTEPDDRTHRKTSGNNTANENPVFKSELI
jgi:hypothetical protein